MLGSHVNAVIFKAVSVCTTLRSAILGHPMCNVILFRRSTGPFFFFCKLGTFIRAE